jgi:hypothetical protein
MNEKDLFAGAEPIPAAHVTYALFDDRTVVLLEPGDRPDGTGVWAADRVDLHRPFPEAVADRLDGPAPIQGFVRLGAECVPLGQLRMSQSRYETVPGGGYYQLARGPLTWALLRPDEPIPAALLDRVRPVAPVVLPDPSGWLATMSGDPLGALAEFVNGWYPIPERPAEPVRPWRELPAPLHALYRLAVGREQVLGVHNRIGRSSELEADEETGRLIIGWENQGVFQWTIDPGLDDPPVWCDDEPEGEPLSRFLLRFVVAEAAMAGPFHGAATLAPAAFAGLERGLTPVPLASADGARLYVAPGVSVLVTPGDDDEVEVWAGACHRSALRPLRAAAEWESLDD